MTTTSTTIDRAALEKEGWLVIETEEERLATGPCRQGDEYFYEGEWLPSTNWKYTGEFMRETVYRRRIAQPAPVAASPWIAFSDRRPSESDGEYVWVAGPDQLIPQTYRLPMGHFLYPYTHWLPASAIPPLPVERKKSQEELDRDEAEAWLRSAASPSPMNAKEWAAMAFIAGLRHARAQGKEGV